jgi:hypothetical protein
VRVKDLPTKLLEVQAKALGCKAAVSSRAKRQVVDLEDVVVMVLSDTLKVCEQTGLGEYVVV